MNVEIIEVVVEDITDEALECASGNMQQYACVTPMYRSI